MTPEQWVPISRRFFGSFPKMQVDERTVAAYFAGLHDLSAADIEAATIHLALTYTATFLPAIADIRQAAVDVIEGRLTENPQLPDFTGVVAWLEEHPSANRLDFLEATGQLHLLDRPQKRQPVELPAAVARIGKAMP